MLIQYCAGGHGSLKTYNELYDTAPDIPSDAVKIEIPRIEESKYIKALNATGSTTSPELPTLSSDTTRYWADYCNVFHHPRSLLEVSGYVYDPIRAPKGLVRGTSLDGGRQRSNAEFRGWETGVEEFKTEINSAGAEALDTQFRSMLEECDMLGGVNVVVDVDSAWGGFASEALSMIRDEYTPKSAVVVWGMEDPGDLRRDELKSRIETMLALSSAATAYVPLALPDSGVFVKSLDSLWEAGAIYNLAFETLTLPARVRVGESARAELSELIEAATKGVEGERQIVSDVRIAVGENEVAVGGENSVSDSWMDARSRRRSRERLTQAKTTVLGSTGVVRGNASEEELTNAWARFAGKDTWALVRDARLAIPRTVASPELALSAADIVSVGARSTSRTAVQLGNIESFVQRWVRSSERGEILEQLEETRHQYSSSYRYGDDGGDDDDDDDDDD